VLGKGTWENDKEIPFEFSDREIGASKLKIRTIIEYAQQVLDITLYSFTHHQSAAWREWKKIFKFGIVGLTGVVVNQGLLVFLKEVVGLALPIASIIAIQTAILNNFIWNDIWTFKETSQPQKISNRWHRLLAFEVVSAGGAVINFVVLNLMVLFLATDYQIANIIGILLGFIWNFMVNRRFTWVKNRSDPVS
jgi:dolichol-phosphate mannosyltransferase